MPTAALPCGPAMIKNLTLGQRRTFRSATATPNRLSHFLTARRRGGKPAVTLPLKPPRIDLLESHSEGDDTLVKVRVASPRGADVITVHADRPVQTAVIEAAGQPAVSSLPSYPDDLGSRAWPYELRSTTLRRMGSFSHCSHAVSVFLDCTSVTTPLAWSGCPGSGRGPPVSVDQIVQGRS